MSLEPPHVDVVMLSRAGNGKLQQMTQRAIDTCLAGSRGYHVNIVVLEQIVGVTYENADTVEAPSSFNYNAFANRGASYGSAPWIMIANNDLVFERNWLDPLLDTGHPLMSPMDPTNHQQNGIVRNQVGTQNRKHLSGWCYMISRDLWKRIGGFDEDFFYWCADDSLIEQVKAVGVLPMVVPRSRVRHLTSQTMTTKEDVDGSMTWAQVYKFEQKYRVHHFGHSRGYADWKRRNPQALVNDE